MKGVKRTSKGGNFNEDNIEGRSNRGGGSGEEIIIFWYLPNVVLGPTLRQFSSVSHPG